MKTHEPSDSKPERESDPDTTQKLLDAAIVLFSKKGFEATTVKELAEEAGVNVSLVSYHFGSKEGLYKRCLGRFANEKLEFSQRVLQPPQSLEDMRVRLETFIDEFFRCLTQPQQACISRILHRELDGEIQGVALEVFRETLLKSHETLLGFFKSAQQAGLMRPEMDAMIVAQLFWNAVASSARMDHINLQFFGLSLRQPEYKAKFIENLMQSFFFGFYPERKSK